MVSRQKLEQIQRRPDLRLKWITPTQIQRMTLETGAQYVFKRCKPMIYEVIKTLRRTFVNGPRTEPQVLSLTQKVLGLYGTALTKERNGD